MKKLTSSCFSKSIAEMQLVMSKALTGTLYKNKTQRKGTKYTCKMSEVHYHRLKHDSVLVCTAKISRFGSGF